MGIGRLDDAVGRDPDVERSHARGRGGDRNGAGAPPSNPQRQRGRRACDHGNQSNTTSHVLACYVCQIAFAISARISRLSRIVGTLSRSLPSAYKKRKPGFTNVLSDLTK